jgi:anti-sigma B factor antagonist
MASLDRKPPQQSPPDSMSLSLSYDGDVFLIELFGELDLASAPELEQVIARAEATDAGQIVVDLSGLEFIDSTGISLLIRSAHRSNMNAGRLRLLRGTGQVERVMRLCRLHGRLPFAD